MCDTKGGGVILTYLVGASASSMSPLMKMAMALAEALISSWALETDNLAMSSSSALSDLEFSDLTSEACKAAGAILQYGGRELRCRVFERAGGILIWTKAGP